ncbi:MAG: FAD:protein FMN transferase [Candidatus Marinimicrobia bacterium]|nr:FAD:protein FMN transferase [Candidatus Neomarinimicrobiota bacterium]
MTRSTDNKRIAPIPGLVSHRAEAGQSPENAGRSTLKYSQKAMATIYELFLQHEEPTYAAQAASACFALLQEIEQELSRFIPGSDVSAIADLRRGEKMVLGPHTFACLTTAQKVAQETGGAFDIAYLSKQEAPGTERSPAEDPLFRLDDGNRVIQSQTDRLLLDLGGIGKGYALDSMAETLREWELDQALLQGGRSSLLALGPPQHADGWALTISHPDQGVGQLASITLENQAMGASGIMKGPHIRAPLGSDSPGIGPIRAAWSLGKSAAEMDALSTAAMLVSEPILVACCQRFDCSVARLVSAPAEAVPVPGDQLLLYGARRDLFVPV